MAIRNHWTQSVAAASGGNSEPVFLPRRIGSVSVAALPGGGATSTVQFSLDEQDAIAAAPGAANWVDWEAGPVVDKTARALAGPVTAIRIASAGGPSTLQVVGWFDY